MNNFKQLVSQLGFYKTQPPPNPGVYHFKHKTKNGEARMHLRIDADGSGILLVNASRVYHFNSTAAYMTYLFLQGIEFGQAIKTIRHQYKVTKNQAKSDFKNICEQINLITTPNFEKVASQVRFFTGMIDSQLNALKKAVHGLGNTELSEQIRFLVPTDSDELPMLIPAISALDAETSTKLINRLTLLNEIELADRIDEIISISPEEITKLAKAYNEPDDMLEPVWDTILPFSRRDISAPYRMDLALTYHCNNDCHHCYNAPVRSREELDTNEWKGVLDSLWEIGIPHIIFTGGEPTLRPDLAELIAHAENNGQITGLNTNGRRLKDPDFVQKLVDAGLDHLQITLESHIPQIHDDMVSASGAWEDTVSGIKNALSTRLYVMTNTTLLEDNHSNLEETLEFLSEIGVKKVGLNALIYSGRGLSVRSGLPESALSELLDTAISLTNKNDQDLTWYTPTQYCHFDPVLFDSTKIGVKGCTAALANMCIEPDGNVIPCQSYYQSIGNILTNTWEQIWHHEQAVKLRERRDLPKECTDCAILPVCGGGCPLARLADQIAPPKSVQFIEA
jgi:radical SAM protein with 4Fe4S-binding SPASM domain